MNLIARLKQVEYVGLLLGALRTPGGFGEQLLRGSMPQDDAHKPAREQALAVLDSVRRCHPSEQFLATSLLDYLQNHPVNDTVKPAKVAQAPPAKGILPITAGSDLSEYFFS
ncbi:MAG: hypothetical protein ACREEP_09045 [Dongiaceae bacterium]